VRTWTAYSYQYKLESNWGSTTHGYQGFGIFVRSWDLKGRNPFTDLDYRYILWSDGTGWFDHHYNLSFPDHDNGFAFLYGHEAPYFPAQTDRVYYVCLWAFDSTNSGFFGLSNSLMNAGVVFIGIGEE
jgi:hypothetical protein